MFEKHAKLMSFIQTAQLIHGRKKLQKMIYVAQKCGLDFQEKFSFHFYGPYSEELSVQIEELSGLGFVHEEAELFNGYERYTYSLSEQGVQYLQHYRPPFALDPDLIRFLNQQSSRILELVATLLYFNHLNDDDRRMKVKQTKHNQSYTDEDVNEALQFMNKLEMTSVY